MIRKKNKNKNLGFKENKHTENVDEQWREQINSENSKVEKMLMLRSEKWEGRENGT